MADAEDSPKPAPPHLAEMDRRNAELAEWRRLQPRLLPDVSTLSEYRVRTTAGRVNAGVYLWNEGGANPKPDAMREAHRLMFGSATKDAGQFRVPGQPGVFGGGRDAADPRRIGIELERLHAEMAELLGSSRTAEDRCAAIGYYHARFIGIHPFLDGNGRTGRAIMEAQANLLGLKFDLGKILENKPEYLRAIGAALDKNDVAPLMRVVGRATGTPITHVGELEAAAKIRSRPMLSIDDIGTLADERERARVGDVLSLPSEHGGRVEEPRAIPGSFKTIVGADWEKALSADQSNSARQAIHESIAKLAIGGKLPAKHQAYSAEWAATADISPELRAALQEKLTQKRETPAQPSPAEVFMEKVEALRGSWNNAQTRETAKKELGLLVRGVGAGGLTGVPLSAAAARFLEGNGDRAAVITRLEAHLAAGAKARALGIPRTIGTELGHSR